MANAVLPTASGSVVGRSERAVKISRVAKAAVAVLTLTTLASAGGWIAATRENERLRSAKPVKEIADDNAAGEKAAREIEELKTQLAAAGQVTKTTSGKLENELQAAHAAPAKAEKELLDLKKQLTAGDRSDKTTVAKLQSELQETRTAHERAVKELKQLRQQALPVKEREPPTVKIPIRNPAKATREIAQHVDVAKEQRDRSTYDAALSELNVANSLYPANEEIAAEIDKRSGLAMPKRDWEEPISSART